MANRYVNTSTVKVTASMTDTTFVGVKSVTINQQGNAITSATDNDAFITFAHYPDINTTLTIESEDVSSLNGVAANTEYDSGTVVLEGKGPGTVADITITLNKPVSGPLGQINAPHGVAATISREFTCQATDATTNPLSFA